MFVNTGKGNCFLYFSNDVAKMFIWAENFKEH